MAGKSYFFSVFTIVSLTGGLVFAVDAQALIGLLTAILRIVFVILGIAVLVASIALLFGPQEQ